MAIIKSKLDGLEASLILLKKLEANNVLKNYHLLPATQGIFNLKQGKFQEAKTYLEKSLQLNPSSKEIEFIKSKIAECEKSI